MEKHEVPIFSCSTSQVSEESPQKLVFDTGNIVQISCSFYLFNYFSKPHISLIHKKLSKRTIVCIYPCLFCLKFQPQPLNLHKNPLSPQICLPITSYNILMQTHHQGQRPNRRLTRKQSTVRHLQTDVRMKTLNSVYKQIKKKMQISRFISNITRNNIHSKPVVFSPEEGENKQGHILGIDFNPVVENVILMLDIIATLASFFISPFEAFLDDYLDFKKENQAILIIPIVTVVIYCVKAFMLLVDQEIQHGVQYIYLRDIVKKEIFKGRFLIQIGLIIIIILSLAMQDEPKSTQSTIGIVYFVLCVLKLYEITFSLFRLEIMLIDTVKKERYWNLTKVLILNLLFAHFMASIFLAMLRMGNAISWYNTKYNAPVDPYWFELYVWAFYWSCTTMITVGYGDFSAATAGQAVIVSFLEILSSIVIAYNISQIGSIILAINQRNQVVNSKIGLLRRMDKENEIPIDLSLDLQQYVIQEENIKEDFEYTRHKELIESMPQQLQKRYYDAAHRNIYRKLPFFMNLGSQSLTTFYQNQEGKVYYPGEFIISKSIPQEITIILKGELGFCYRKNGSILNETVIETLQVNYSKNQPIFLARNVLNKNQGIYFDIKATKYSYGVKFSIEKFLEILKESQVDYQYYLMTLDLHQAQTSIAVHRCLYCTGFHTKFQCPKLHYMPLSTMVIARFNRQRGATQYRQFAFRKDNSENIRHAYKFKSSFSTEDIKQFQHDINDEEGYNHLIMVMKSYGAKKVKANMTNRGVENVVKDEKLLSIYLHHDDVSQKTEGLDEIYDFHHYFVQCNAQNLLSTPLKKGRRASSWSNW